MLIKIKVKPSQSRNIITKISDNTLHISVKEPPENNLANLRVIKLISEHFIVSPKAVHIIRGHHKTSKLLSIDLPGQK